MLSTFSGQLLLYVKTEQYNNTALSFGQRRMKLLKILIKAKKRSANHSILHIIFGRIGFTVCKIYMIVETMQGMLIYNIVQRVLKTAARSSINTLNNNFIRIIGNLHIVN